MNLVACMSCQRGWAESAGRRACSLEPSRGTAAPAPWREVREERCWVAPSFGGRPDGPRVGARLQPARPGRPQARNSDTHPPRHPETPQARNSETPRARVGPPPRLPPLRLWQRSLSAARQGHGGWDAGAGLALRGLGEGCPPRRAVLQGRGTGG